MTKLGWNADKLNRRVDADHLRKNVLIKRYKQRLKAGEPASYILNLDAEWGQGKTFFLQRLREDLEADGYPVCYVNAWQDDLSNEPIVAIMSAIEERLMDIAPRKSKARASFRQAKKKLGVVALEASKQVALHGLKLTTGISAKHLADTWNGTEDSRPSDDAKDVGKISGDAVFEVLKSSFAASIKSHRESIKAIAKFKQHLEQTIDEITASDIQFEAPLFVFIDELDRCRPLYAIRLLEDAKHLFQVAGVVFVIATDSTQLANSIKAVYGAEFGSREYLRRFFDRTYVFPHSDRESVIRMALMSKGIDLDTFASLGTTPPIDIMRQWCRGFGLSIRDLEQVADIMETFVTTWTHSCKINIFLLLMNIYAFYTSNPRAWIAFSEFAPVALTDENFRNWQVKYKQKRWKLTPSGGATFLGEEGRQTSGLELFDQLCAAFRADLKAGVSIDTKSVWLQYLGDDTHWGDIPLPKRQAILDEYTSRVWNAGRNITRPPAL